MADIDKLDIEISASAGKAVKEIDRLQKAVGQLNSVFGSSLGGVSVFKNALNGIGTGADISKLENLSKSIRTVSRSFSSLQRTFSAGFNTAGLANGISEINKLSVNPSNADGISKIVSAITKLNAASANASSSNLQKLAIDLRQFVSSLNGLGASTFNADSLGNLAKSIAKLGGVKIGSATANLPALSKELEKFVISMNALQSVSFDTTGLVNLANAISRLGGKNAQNAISNIPLLKDKISELISELSKMPSVSASAQRTLDSIAKIAQYTRGNLGSATNSVNRFSASSTSAFDSIKKAAAGVVSAFGKIGAAAGKLTGIERLFTKIKRLAPASRETESGFKGLAQKIGMLYASSFLAVRGFNKLKDGIESAMDYVEAYDYFKNAFNAIGKNADLSQWKKLGYDSAEAYYNSFRDRAEKVSSELTGFSIGKYGELTESKMPSLGLNPTQVMQTQAMFGQMSNSMGIAADTATKLSEVYTKLGADMASAFNMPFKEVWGNLQSGMVGMSRAVDKYGINIRNANLQQELANLGIDASINKLSQQDKVLLRTIVILNSSSQAWGNLAQTIQSPQNQIRLLTMNFHTLGQMIGSFFLPIVSKVLPYINGMVIALKSLVSHIGSLLGIDLSEYMKSMSASSSEGFSDALDASDGLADNIDNVGKATDKATKKQKKFNKQLQAFDELNNLTTNENEKNPSGANSSSGSPGGVGADLNAALDDAMKKYLEAWDKAFGEMEDKANNIANNIKNAFVKAWETGSGKEIGKKIASFVNKGLTWVDKNQKKFNSGLKKIAGILGTGINGFVKDLEWEDLGGIIGTGIKGAIEAETEFFKTVDWTNLGAALAKTLNSAIKTGVLKSYFKNMASKLKAGIETAFGFVKKFDFKNLGTAVGNGIKSFFTDMSKKNKKTGLNGWQELGQTLSTGISGISTAITEALKTVSWQDIGQAIVDFIGAIDFSDTGWKLGKLASALGNAVYQLVSNKEMWSNLGQKIADGINGFFSGMSAVDSKTGLTGWQSLGKSISDTILGLGDAIITALDGIHWQDVGQAIGTLIGTIDWGAVVWKLGSLAASIIKAIGTAIKGVTKTSPITTAIAVLFAGIKFGKKIKGFQNIGSAIVNSLINFKPAKNLASAIANAIKPLIPEVSSLLPPIVLGVAAAGFTEWALTAGFENPFEETDVTTVSEAFASLQGSIDKVNSSAEKTKELLANLSSDKDWSTEDTALDTLAREYEKLAKKAKKLGGATKLTASEQKKLKIMGKKLIEQVPTLKEKIDITTGAYKGTWEQLRKNVKKTKELYKLQALEQDIKDLAEQELENDLSTADAKDKLGKAETDYLNAKTAYEKDEAKVAKWEKFLDEHGEGWTKDGEHITKKMVEDYAIKQNKKGGTLSVYLSMEKAYNKAKKALEKLEVEQGKIKKKEKLINKVIEEKQDAYASVLDTIKDIAEASGKVKTIKVSAKMDEKSKKTVDNFKGLTNKTIKAIAKAEKTGDYSELTKTWGKLKNGAKKALTAMLKGKLDKEGTQEVLSAWDKIPESSKKTLKATLKGEDKQSFKDVASSFNSLKNKTVTVTATGSDNGLSEVTEAYDDVEDGGKKNLSVNMEVNSDDESFEKAKEKKKGLSKPITILAKIQKDKDSIQKIDEKIKDLKQKKILLKTKGNLKGAKEIQKEINALNKQKVKIKANIAADRRLKDYYSQMLKNGQPAGMPTSAWNAFVANAEASLALPTYAKGGFPKTGQVYLARERGSELVGQIGNRHAVANNDQITDAVSDAVFNALNPLMTRMANAIIGLEQSIQSNSGTTLSVAGVSDGDIVRIVKNEDTNYRRRTGKSIFA